ncbi:hypothetical protein Tco_0936983 [Tanacetum coccineum]|uniref:Uncharacterized protein n=1 Tax=Tanacetum coccineum TaxID=301880 RepID=A0ABQ5DDW0_9ASTR
MDYVKKSIEKRALHKMEYDSRVNERLMQTTEEKVDSSKALDASLVIIESNGTESQEQDTSSRSGNDAHVDDADIRPIYNEEPMAEVQTSAEINIFATGQQHTEQPEFNNEGEVDQNTEQCHDIRPLPAKLTDNMTTELSDQSLESENASFLHQNDFYHNRSELGIQDHSNEPSSSKHVPKVVPSTVKTATSRQESNRGDDNLNPISNAHLPRHTNLESSKFKDKDFPLTSELKHFNIIAKSKDNVGQKHKIDEDGKDDKDNDKGSKSRSQSMKEQAYNK